MHPGSKGSGESESDNDGDTNTVAKNANTVAGNGISSGENMEDVFPSAFALLNFMEKQSSHKETDQILQDLRPSHKSTKSSQEGPENVSIAEFRKERERREHVDVPHGLGMCHFHSSFVFFVLFFTSSSSSPP
jgi:hypothetical protein